MRIFCIGDSLGMPREGVMYEDTWYYKLKKTFSSDEFIERFERGLLMSTALGNFDPYYVFYPSDIVIIQTGICDCSPRYIIEDKTSVRVIQAIFKKLNMIDFFWKIVKLRGRKPSCVVTPLDDFSFMLNKLLSNFIQNGVSHVVLVKIGHVADSVVKRNTFINENIDKYNEAIETVAANYPRKISIVNPLDKIKENIFVDGYHCNAQGMDIVFQSLKLVLDNYHYNVKGSI